LLCFGVYPHLAPSPFSPPPSLTTPSFRLQGLLRG
jgi:hypothetical protein